MEDHQGHVPVAKRSTVNYDRKMLTRSNPDCIKVVKSIPPGEDTFGCVACCHAPSCCALLSMCPCCTNPEYIIHKRAASKYIFVRENSIEWNEPEIVLRNGPCFGVDPCVYDIEDHISVIYFDNPLFNRMTDQTRVCNECRTCICGGRGERIQIDSPCCCGCCLRSYFPCPCLPICCPSIYFPCAKRHILFVEDAQMAMHEIKNAMSAVKQLHAPHAATAESSVGGGIDNSSHRAKAPADGSGNTGNSTLNRSREVVGAHIPMNRL